MSFCACGCGKAIIPKRFHKWYGIPKYFSAIHATKHRIKGKKSGKANFKGKHHTEQHKYNIFLRYQRERTLKDLRFNFQVFPWNATSNNDKLLKSLCNANIIKYRCLKTEESRQKIGRSRKGKLHPLYIDGRSFQPYCEKFNLNLKTAIKERDNYTCQNCGELNLKKLRIHHIHYDKENCYPDLITVCIRCNSKANFSREYWKELFMNKLNDRGLLFWTKFV